jgi:hypothetical protein
MRLGVVIVGLSFGLGASTSSARADDERSGESEAVQASLDCRVGGKALSPEKPNVIGGHVACAVVLDGFSGEGLAAEAWIEQDGVESEHRHTTAAPGGDDADDEIRFDPFRRGEEVRACRPFTIHARVTLGDEVVWSTDLDVKAKCKKPKKVAAKLSCTFVAADATVYAWPGNGAKQKPPLDDTLACWVRGPKTGGDTMTATIGSYREPLWQDDDTRAYSSAQMLEPDLDFQTCEPFTVLATIANRDGQIVWSGKQAIAQTCQ